MILAVSRRGWLGWAAAAAAIWGCTPWLSSKRIVAAGGEAMGTTWSAKIVAPDRGWDRDRLAATVQGALDFVDVAMSTYKPYSEVSRFNLYPPRQWFSFSPQAFKVIEAGVEISALSGGAFDITVGPLVDAYGFGAAGRVTAPPDAAALAAALAAVGSDKLSLDRARHRVLKTHAGTRIDLSAIAKGFAVDYAVQALRSAGVTSMIVEVGGEVWAEGRKPDGTAWTVGLEAPSPEGPVVARALPLDGAGMATSGDYRNFYGDGDARITHIIDPRTGRSVQRPLAAVTVVASDTMTADAWATALMVLGLDAGLETAERLRLRARFVVADPEGGYTEHMSRSFLIWSGLVP